MGRDNPSTPSPARSSAFSVGRNSRGNWVAQDQDGLRGGLFVSRAEAVRFAQLANIHHPQDVIMVPGTLELDMRDRVDASAGELPAQFESIANSVVALRRLSLAPNRTTHASPDLVPGGEPERQDTPRKVANGR
jgi:hypothetical protein